MNPSAPRHFVATPVIPGAGLPHDRMARLAARQAFVGLKRSFTEALAHAGGPRGDWLREQVRRAEEPEDLWLLRAAVFRAVSGQDTESRRVRQNLRRGLDALFLDSGPPSAFTSF